MTIKTNRAASALLVATLVAQAGCGGYRPLTVGVEGEQCVVRDPGRNETIATDSLVGQKVKIVTRSRGELLGKVVAIDSEEIMLAIEASQAGVGATGTRVETIGLDDVRSLQLHEVNTADTIGMAAIGLAGAYAVWALLDSFNTSSR